MNYRAPQKISKLAAMMQLFEAWNHTKPQGEYVVVQKNPCELSKPTVSWHNIQIVAISSVSNLQLLTCCKAIYSACQRTRLSSWLWVELGARQESARNWSIKNK